MPSSTEESPAIGSPSSLLMWGAAGRLAAAALLLGALWAAVAWALRG